MNAFKKRAVSITNSTFFVARKAGKEKVFLRAERPRYADTIYVSVLSSRLIIPLYVLYLHYTLRLFFTVIRDY